MIIVWLVVYASTGLFFCFFLPVGAVLFITGVLAVKGDVTYDIFTICGLLIPAAILETLRDTGLVGKPGLYFTKEKIQIFQATTS
jgi:hypothetical protein